MFGYQYPYAVMPQNNMQTGQQNGQQNGQQPSINQTFQLAPNQGGLKYTNSIDDVNKELVFTDSVFFSKDFNQMWIKNVKGEVRTYDITEVIQKDEKDLIIDDLRKEIEELKKGVMLNEQSTRDDVEAEESSSIQRNRATKTK